MQPEKRDYEFLDPWFSTDEETEGYHDGFLNRLQAAVGPEHVLYGLPMRLRGHSSRLSNTLFEILDGTGRLAVVHLTRTEAREPPPSPKTTIYPNFEAFKSETMVPQHRDYLATPDPEQLIAAAEGGNLDLIRQQVELGVDIDAVDFPTGTALSAAAAENQVEAAKLLIELGADLEKTDDSPMPMTALFKAVSNGHEEMARLLLEHKADPNAMFLTWASTPRNCLEYLKDQGMENTSLYKLLLDYGAEPPTYIKMVEKYPEKAAYIAEAVVSAERFDDAVELTTYLIEKRPNSTLHYQRGVAHDMTENPAAALADFDAAIALDAGNFQALYSRSLVQTKLGRWQESVADLEAARKVNPSDYYTLNALAVALLRSPHESMRNPERAVQLANDACELSDWNDVVCIATLAEAYRKIGDENKAAEWDRKAAELRER
jgi:tetratricopeptide (TPR) repeat protein